MPKDLTRDREISRIASMDFGRIGGRRLTHQLLGTVPTSPRIFLHCRLHMLATCRREEPIFPCRESILHLMRTFGEPFEERRVSSSRSHIRGKAISRKPDVTVLGILPNSL